MYLMVRIEIMQYRDKNIRGISIVGGKIPIVKIIFGTKYNYELSKVTKSY